MRNLIRGLVFAAAIACVSADDRLGAPMWQDPDDHLIPRPEAAPPEEGHALIYNSVLRHADLEHNLRLLRRHPSLNVNAWDEVPDSSWFTNRIGRRALAWEEIVAGLEGRSPAAPPWTVVEMERQGMTPKFVIEDGKGDRYILKFDLPDRKQKHSASERISTLIFHAAGYNVPRNELVFFDPDALEAGGEMDPERLAELIGELRLEPDGRIRGLVSHFLEGEPLGPFRYTGRRQDDPNDVIPHEYRRELRGLRVLASWVNHPDVKYANTLDCFVPVSGERGYVRHYLIDFGSTLGAGRFHNGPFRVGHEYLLDFGATGKSLFTLGLWRRPWEKIEELAFEEIGYFTHELFSPQDWKPNYPNLAFLRMDPGDAYWGAKIVTAFDDPLIDRLAREGRYRTPGAPEYLSRTLKLRRDAIGRHWFSRITPAEDFSLDGSVVEFRDLGVERGYLEPEGRRYTLALADGRGRRLWSGQAGSPRVDLPKQLLDEHRRAAPADRFGRRVLFRLRLAARGEGYSSAPVDVFLGLAGEEERLQVLGWRHAAD